MFYHQDERDRAVEYGGYGCLVIVGAIIALAVVSALLYALAAA